MPEFGTDKGERKSNIPKIYLTSFMDGLKPIHSFTPYDASSPVRVEAEFVNKVPLCLLPLLLLQKVPFWEGEEERTKKGKGSRCAAECSHISMLTRSPDEESWHLANHFPAVVSVLDHTPCNVLSS